MESKQSFGRKTGAVLVGCASAGLIGIVVALAASGSALAQGGTPAPGWVQTPGGGWVPPDHPLAGAVPPANVPFSSAPCGLHTLQGSYIFAASGYNIMGGVPVPKAIVETIDFHGDGTLTVPAVTVSVGGTVSQGMPSAGSYTLDSTCKGTVTFIGPSFDIFVGPSGREAWMIQTNPNTVFQGTVTRVGP